jgi:RNA polymerase sigma factor (sigma-70 family)
MRDICTAEDGGSDFGPEFFERQGWLRFQERDQKFFTEARKPATRGFGDLGRRRWYHPILRFSEERDLLRAARSGDAAAKEKLFKSFHRLILKISNQYRGPPHNDLFSAGIIGFLEAVDRFDLKRNSGRLATFAEPRIRNRVRQEVKQWNKGGEAGETRADRWLYHNRWADVQQVIAAVGGSIADAEAAIARAAARAGGHAYYDATECAYDDHSNYVAPRQPATHDIYREYDFFSPYQSSPQLRFHKPLSRLIDELAELTLPPGQKTRGERRMTQIGRRPYALELVKRDRARAAARANPNNYLYPWKREAA